MRDEFIRIYNENIHRKGADKLLAWLESTDFFKAPASTRFHLSRLGGLVEHSVHVYERLRALCDFEAVGNKKFVAPEAEAIAVCGLLHDICKAYFYKIEMRNRKNDQGKWEQYPVYIVDDQFPYGHGEKSVFLIERLMRLLPEEAIAIRWHMGGWDDAAKGGSYACGTAFSKYPLAALLHVADLNATYLDENNEEEN